MEQYIPFLLFHTKSYYQEYSVSLCECCSYIMITIISQVGWCREKGKWKIYKFLLWMKKNLYGEYHTAYEVNNRIEPYLERHHSTSTWKTVCWGHRQSKFTVLILCVRDNKLLVNIWIKWEKHLTMELKFVDKGSSRHTTLHKCFIHVCGCGQTKENFSDSICLRMQISSISWIQTWFALFIVK